MIPEPIDRYLKQHHLAYEHTVHVRAVPAQRLAAAEHVSGERIAKPVVVDLDGRLALAVVSATQRVDLEALRRVTGAERAALAPEPSFQGRFPPCEVGAEPPLGLFGLPIFVDDALAHEPWIVVRGGTHEDALRLDTAAWLRSEHVVPVERLGLHPF
ncbi:aminoacyl-tRNA deacylase [Anaeromyxobacter sp. Fw109-5]|uniref:aminoacyl-tRNA deacylase n=1 Tax=Anaeromyxobacter sp. (strain Fw109-5) TaxID=404589 RepID=UPI000158A4DD|nr:YbaK/EbsC family protein [Anaeromyxobacter sp. Fw109-5]ABS25006.1 YbaK/prolyl-tRNA synthetase associated region [Anaeromyxobacter sp. Fw109-5]